MKSGVFILIFCFLGCSHLEKIPGLDPSRSIIEAHCEFFNLDGVRVRQYAGELCVPFDNGDLVISDDKTLARYNKKNERLWIKPELVHHHLKKSFNNKDVFFFSSTYVKDGNGLVRHDSIKVVDENGVQIKFFDFSKYIEQQIQRKKHVPIHVNIWTHDRHKNRSFEYTHANSIYEIMSPEGELTGYIVNERELRRVFIFDSELKTIISEIDFPEEVMHDVSFLNADTLIYYVNHKVGGPYYSYVATYNIKTKERKIVYGNSEVKFFSQFNGGVQVLGHDLFFITHSPESFRSYIHLINGSGKVLKKIVMRGSRRLVQEAKLENYNEFLKNNVGN